MKTFLAILILLSIDQWTRFAHMDSIWYVVNTSTTEYRWPLVAAGMVMASLIACLAKRYQLLYGSRPLFTLFYVLVMSSILSTIVDRVLFGGGRDFIPVGEYYIANMGDIYFVFAFVALLAELVSNKKGSLRDFMR